MRPTRQSQGYMLLEATVAILVLGIVSLAIHGATRQAIQSRAQAQDFTHAAFLMEDYLSTLELNKQVATGEWEGTFEGHTNRFSYVCTIRPAYIPSIVVNTSDDPAQPIYHEESYPADSSFMLHVALTARWTRGEIPFEETIETLLPPTQLYIPSDVAAPVEVGNE